jgi:hypothetical protein
MVRESSLANPYITNHISPKGDLTVRYPIITDEGKPTAEQSEECNRRARELVALWIWNDNWEENALLVRDARKDAMVRQWPELFRD